MSEQISLREAERKAFRMTLDHGLWDILLGCFFLMFAIAPTLSSRLGDFWSSAIFVPFWGIAFLVVWLLKRTVVSPRVGVVKFGHARKERLWKVTLVMLGLNVAALILGAIAALNFGKVPGQLNSIVFGLILLMFLTVGAYFLDVSRLYVYALLVGLSPLVGEWLYNNVGAAHHGFPITFGTSAGSMIIVGLFLFLRLLREAPAADEDFRREEQ